MIETGKILQQRYRIDKQIGQGGMGAVYLATDERFGNTVAVKETLCMDDNYRKAIEREARLLNSLKHAALPRVSDHFLEENGQFLVMEYIPGEDLSVILETTGKPFPFDKVLKWADQLLDALEFLHTQSMPVIHRDIKPQNLKLTAKENIVLLDFGLAKGNPTEAGFQTAAKSIFGYSRNYASLEQIQGTGTDPRSDLYSLAATLYHLATGQVPEDALTRAMAVLSKRPDPLVPASSLNEEVPAGFAGVLQKAMDLNADQRPSSASEMREMLKDMDRWAYLALESHAAETVANHDLGGQKTKLMPGVTKHAEERLTGVKTEILPAYISQETAIRTDDRRIAAISKADTAAAATSGGKRKIAVAAVGLLLLLCGLTAGAFVYDPAMFGAASRTRPEEPREPAPVPPREPENAAVPPASDLVEAEDQAEDGVPETGARSEQAVPRADIDKAQAKQTSKAPKASASADDGDDDDPEVTVGEEFKFDGKNIYVGNVKIESRRVEAPEFYVDQHGVRRKVPNPPRVPPNGPYMVPDMKYLTTEQQRKFEELRRKGLWPPPAAAKRPRTQGNNQQGNNQ